MQKSNQNRRDFLKTTGVALAAGWVPYGVTSEGAQAFDFRNPNDRPIIGSIGTGDRWNGVGRQAMRFGDVVAVADVDREHVEKATRRVQSDQDRKGKPAEVAMHEDYRNVLDRNDIDIITIVTPDHWHTKIAIEAMQAGKDVYCEKPLTLTIDEGKQIIQVLRETGRVFQVGTQQRSEMSLRFLRAVALVKAGRIGSIKKVQCAIGGAPTSEPLDKKAPPEGLNWDMWLGQTPWVDYVAGPAEKSRPKSRCHYEFRWWYEYSGGKMTDWGAHHVDIAQWAIGMENSGPVSVEGICAEHPVPFENGHPMVDNQYNTATRFLVRCMFPNGVEMSIRDDTANGIRFEGTEGELFVSRSSLKGEAVDDLDTNPLPEEALTKLYKGKQPGDHMRNFMECVKDREQPISDVFTHHRAVTTCHLANIAIRLGRKILWNPETEMIVGDKDAQLWQAREQRKGYEINV